MIVREHINTLSPIPQKEYDTLVVSQDRTLFNQFSSFLKEFEPDRKPLLADHQLSQDAFENILHQCDVMICDMRSDFNSIDLGAIAMQCTPIKTLPIGLVNDHNLSQEVLNHPQNVRLAGIIDANNGWYSNWHQISTIKQAWSNPLMVSRIEEVPVSDILQMITSGRWNNVVYIEGYTGATPPSPNQQSLRGCISFYHGEPQTAWSWRSTGIEAMFDLLSIKHGVLQVMKNHCTPTIRNVYLQTEEILLSHAVALDESKFFGSEHDRTRDFSNLQLLTPDHDKSDTADTKDKYHLQNIEKETNNNWWKTNGSQIIKAISDAPPQSFPLRWMTNDEIERIEREQDNAEFYTIFGSDAMLVKLFGACAKGFSSRKLHDTSRIPVMRLGRSGDACLYLIGNECTAKNASAAHRHSALFIDGDVAAACTTVIDTHSCASLHIITDHTDEVHFKEYTIPVTFSLTPDFSWQSLTALLTNAISTVMNRE